MRWSMGACKAFSQGDRSLLSELAALQCELTECHFKIRKTRTINWLRVSMSTKARPGDMEENHTYLSTNYPLCAERSVKFAIVKEESFKT
jgi:hypothetical protein